MMALQMEGYYTQLWKFIIMNKRGAEMVEYAIVLACIAAVGVAFYSADFCII